MDNELKTFLLVTLHADGAAGASQKRLLDRARVEGWPKLTEPEFEVMLRKLADERVVISWTPALSAIRWKITEHGSNLLREANLA